MDIALPARFWKERSSAWRAFGDWLLCWIVLPNAGYALLWLVGGPPRPFPILLTGLAGLAAQRASFPVRFALFALAMLVSALFFVAALFNLSILSLIHSVQFAAELDPAASVEYLICGLFVAATLLGAWWLLRRRTALEEPRTFLLAIAAILVTISLDGWMAAGARGSYNRVPAAGAPFTSAARDSGLYDLATGERHALLVMVEAMGQPTDPEVRRRLVDLWARPEVRERYEVITGDTLFYGSTTAGEMRELCGRWGDYDSVMETDDSACLPAILARRGYRTSAWHSFTGRFFDRLTWYPHVGFQDLRFADEILEDGAEPCPGVFPGACDRDVPRQIGAALRGASGPQFLYWLTVNTHLPVLANERLGTEHCEAFDAALARDLPQVCRLLQLYDQSARALAAEISRPDFPATDILIVGDHLPPFFDRQHRMAFEPDRVPWILLRPRRAPSERLAASAR